MGIFRHRHARPDRRIPAEHRSGYVGKIRAESYAAAARDPFIRDFVARASEKLRRRPID